MNDDTPEMLAVGTALILVVGLAAAIRPEVRTELAGTLVILAVIGSIFAVRGWWDRRGATIVDRLRETGWFG
jgi:CHASE2 domain-containing sensor protein